MAGLFRRRRPTHEIVRGTGTIVAMMRSCGDDQAVRFVLRVSVDGGESWDATATASVPEPVIRILRPGAQVGVEVDLREPQAPAIDLSRISVTPG